MLLVKTPVMRKRFLWAALSLVSIKGIAQQQPHYTQYVLNQYIINPAITGIENYMDIKFSHRHQWMGFEGAPVTSYFTAHKSFGGSNMKTTATSFAVEEGGNARGKSYWDQYTAADPHHGIGVQVINDRMGPLNNLSASLTYAYHLGLSEQTSISAGVGVGFNQTGIDASKVDYLHTNVDPAVYTSGQLKKIRPNLNAGLYLYSSKFFLGVSALQVIPQRVEFSDNSVKVKENNLLPHTFITAGYRMLIGDDFNFIPSVMVKITRPVPTQVEFNAKLQYRDLAWIAASYRSTDAVAGMLGISLSNKIMMGYSYDYTTSYLNNFSRGSHEFLLGFVIGNGYDDSCPRNVW
jgi:type IX secretion system PorP/SprF family membrane protein